jgi:hypothetical protein
VLTPPVTSPAVPVSSSVIPVSPGLPRPTTQPGVYRGGVYEPPTTALHRSSTVYGGQTGQPTSANAEAPIEQSGSLTGLILSRGRPAQMHTKERRSRFAKVLVTGLIGLAFVAVIGLVVALLAGDFLSTLFNAVIRH